MSLLDNINLGLVKVFGAYETYNPQEFFKGTDSAGNAYDNTGTNLKDNINPIINWIIGIVGIIAVIVMIYGGVQYMTASGDASKVKRAKDIILYGIIGLIVAALAFAIVNFVLSDAITGGSTPSSES